MQGEQLTITHSLRYTSGMLLDAITTVPHYTSFSAICPSYAHFLPTTPSPSYDFLLVTLPTPSDLRLRHGSPETTTPS